MFSIQCFECQKQFQSGSIPKRCKFCKKRDLEIKDMSGSIVDIDNSLIFNSVECEKCGKIKSITSSDALPEEIEAEKESLKRNDNWCERNCNVREREQNSPPSSLKLYFQKNNVKSLTLEENNWKIEKNDGSSEIIACNNLAELQEAKAYLQEHNLKSITSDELLNNPTSLVKEPFYKNPLVIGGTILVIILLGAWYLLRNKDKKIKWITK